MREPAAEGFYPADGKVLATSVDGLLKAAKTRAGKDVAGAIVPHAGYPYSGDVAANVFKSLPKADIVVVIGTNHTGIGERVAVSGEPWETPLGVVECANDVASLVVKYSNSAQFDELAHMYEHSIEVQLPFLQRVMPGFKLVAITVSSEINGNGFTEVGSAIAKAIAGKNAIVIASSDLTHFGRVYDFLPVDSGEVEWVTKTDREIIDAIIGFRHEDVIALSRETTVCGFGPIATLLSALEDLGATDAKLVKYATSYDVSQSKDAIVGYAGIVFSRVPKGKEKKI